MTTREPEEPGLGGDDAVAAEYVLGVLDMRERQTVERRIESDPGFARLVDRWENRLSSMADAYSAIEPPASVKIGIDRRIAFLGGRRDAAPTTRARLWDNLAIWRGLTLAAAAALAIFVIQPLVIQPPTEDRRAPLVASLEAEGSPVRFLVLLDAGAESLRLSHVAGEHSPERDFELWYIDGDAAPVSLGVLPEATTTELPLSGQVREALAGGAVLAISDEPQGGSPTGAPTGAVVAAGGLRAI